MGACHASKANGRVDLVYFLGVSIKIYLGKMHFSRPWLVVVFFIFQGIFILLLRPSKLTPSVPPTISISRFADSSKNNPWTSSKFCAPSPVEKYRVAVVVPFVENQIADVERFLSNWEFLTPCGKHFEMYSAEVFFYYNRNIENASDVVRCRIQVIAAKEGDTNINF